MRVLLRLCLERRPCGCFRGALSDLEHWRRFGRFRLVARKARGWAVWWGWKARVRLGRAVCRLYGRFLVPTAVGMGFMAPYDALEAVREAEEAEERWKAWFGARTLLGADSDHPEGIYAEGGGDLICMTSEEFKHWYGGRGDSRGGQEGVREGPGGRDTADGGPGRA